MWHHGVSVSETRDERGGASHGGGGRMGVIYVDVLWNSPQSHFLRKPGSPRAPHPNSSTQPAE